MNDRDYSEYSTDNELCECGAMFFVGTPHACEAHRAYVETLNLERELYEWSLTPEGQFARFLASGDS